MSFRRLRRKLRCMFKHGPRGCPHIERHSRRSRHRPPPPVQARRPVAKHALPGDLAR